MCRLFHENCRVDFFEWSFRFLGFMAPKMDFNISPISFNPIWYVGLEVIHAGLTSNILI